MKVPEATGHYTPGVGPGFVCSDAMTRVPGGVVYVHLCSGKVMKVPDTTGVTLTDTDLTLLHGEEVLMRVPRSELYLAACEQCEPPPNA